MIDSVKGSGYGITTGSHLKFWGIRVNLARRLFISITAGRAVVSVGVIVERCPPDIASCVLRVNLQHSIESNIITKAVPWLVGVSDCVYMDPWIDVLRPFDPIIM